MGSNVNAAGVAENMPNFVRQLQRTRMGRAQIPVGQQQTDPTQFQSLLNKVSPDGQEQNAAGTPGALQKEGGQEGGRQRDVRQGETESSPGQSPQLQKAKGKQPGQRMR
jgi:hypothetical protein